MKCHSFLYRTGRLTIPAISIQHGTADDFVLYFFTQLNKEGAVTGHAHNEIAILFRVLLRLLQGLVIDVIKLHLCIAEKGRRAQQSNQAVFAVRTL